MTCQILEIHIFIQLSSVIQNNLNLLLIMLTGLFSNCEDYISQTDDVLEVENGLEQ